MEEIYKKYSRIIYNYLLGLTHNSEIAEELMQETFYSAVKNIDKFRKECSIKVWLCQIAKNKWINKIKKDKLNFYHENLEVIDELSFEDNLENDIISREEIIDLYKKIHKLDEKTREVIYLRIRADLSFKEIGTILNKSEEWARITFYRGKIKLKEWINNE